MARVMVITSSPNTDGLTAACGNAARKGILEAGGDAGCQCHGKSCSIGHSREA